MPNKFYIDIESVGSLPPDEILRQGIKYLQEKLAVVIQSIQGADANGEVVGGYEGGRSPDLNARDTYDDGFTTPYGAAAGLGAGGGTTPYGGYGGATGPYSNGW